MAKKVCSYPGCPALVSPSAYRGLCDEHRKQRDRERGSAADRGYDAEHRAARRAWQQRIDAGRVVICWRPGCDTRIAGTAWHLGHDDRDRSVTRGPECVGCNLSAAGRASHHP